MTEHVHTVDCFVEGVQVCGMERPARDLVNERDHALAKAAAIARSYARDLPTGKASDLIQGRWEGERAASANIAARIEAEMSTHPARQLERQQRGNFFPHVPLLTDKQDAEARAGMCPSCHIEGLVDIGTGEGLRFLGCVACTAVVVLASRPGDRKLMVVTGRYFGRTHLAQQVKLAMRMYDEQGGRATGYCAVGDRCVCGGDTPGVRAGCSYWRKG
jgi:hypothetical protein